MTQNHPSKCMPAPFGHEPENPCPFGEGTFPLSHIGCRIYMPLFEAIGTHPRRENRAIWRHLFGVFSRTNS